MRSQFLHPQLSLLATALPYEMTVTVPAIHSPARTGIQSQPIAPSGLVRMNEDSLS